MKDIFDYTTNKKIFGWVFESRREQGEKPGTFNLEPKLAWDKIIYGVAVECVLGI